MTEQPTDSSRHKKWASLETKWLKESKEKMKPFCPSCAKLDYNIGDLKDIEEYRKGMKEVRRKTFRVDKTGEVEKIAIFYKCPDGHGLANFYRPWELGLDKMGKPIEKEEEKVKKK